MKALTLIITVVLTFTLPAFSQQYDPSLIPYRKGDLWGYANPDKTIAIKPTYNETNWFVAGYAVVKKGTKYGYINKAGKLVIPYKFYSAKPFSYGYFDDKGKHTAGTKVVKNKDTVLFAGASLKPGGAEVCIDTKGLVMSKCPAINENRADNNAELISVTTEKAYSLGSSAVYDKITGDYKLPGDEHTYYIAIKNNRYGLINNVFDVLIPFENDSIKKIDVSGGTLLLVAKNNLHGIYNGNGTVVIPVENSKLMYAKTNQGMGYFIEVKDGAAKLKDANQQDIITGNYTDIIYDDNRGFILTAADNSKGYYFLNKKLVTPKYSEVRSVRGGDFLRVKTKTGKDGYVSAEDIEFFEE